MQLPRYLHLSELDSILDRLRRNAPTIIEGTDWLQTIGSIRSNPLLVKEYRLATNYVIASPPVNSSGDVYHYLAYLIFCRAKRWYVPKVYVAYDNEITKQQSFRCAEIAKQLGFIQHVIPIQINLQNATHANVREKQLRDEMNNRGFKCINQKGVTILLACAYQKYGYKHVTEILQKGFLNFDLTCIDIASLKLIRDHADSKVVEIQRKIQKPIVILNNRVSKGANAQQSLSPDIVEKIRDTVRLQGYELLILSTSGDEINTYKSCPATAAFYGGPGVEAKYGKIYHLILLNKLQKNYNVYGIIGGTSGTLDIAAFLGLHCFNIHEFTEMKSKHTIQAQEYRILTQSVWMTVMPSWSSYVQDNLIAWLRKNNNKHHLAENYKLSSKTNHKDRHPFTCFNNEAISSCSRQHSFHSYQNLIDGIVKNQLKSEREDDFSLGYEGKFNLFDEA